MLVRLFKPLSPLCFVHTRWVVVFECFYLFKEVGVSCPTNNTRYDKDSIVGANDNVMAMAIILIIIIKHIPLLLLLLLLFVA